MVTLGRNWGNWVVCGILFFTSCMNIDLSIRKGKDLQLPPFDFEKINGIYSNTPVDTSGFEQTLYSNFTIGRRDTLSHKNIGNIKITSINANKIILELIENEKTIKTKVLKGKYKKGYFRVRRQYMAEGILGPIVWAFGEHKNYIGISKSNNLVILRSGGSGAMLLIAFPIFVAGGDWRNNEYIRIK